MKYKIGIDFGTTYSKVAYLDDKRNLKVFTYPGSDGKGYVPTAIAYQKAGGHQMFSLGEAAQLDAVNKPDISFCENFKMLLPLENREQWEAHGWSTEKSPAEVVRDYFLRLLREDQHSFEREVGPIESVVVSVPEVWQRTPDNRGTETLRQILVEELSLPVDHLRSEPVCAAAYFAYWYQQVERRPIKGNLLVCDMGGGTFDVALCRVSGQHVEVLDFEGNGHQGLGLAGVVFDRAAVALAYAAVHGESPAPDNWEFLDALREFEKVKIGQHHNVIILLELQSNNPVLSDTPLYAFRRKYQLKYDQVQESFQPIEEGISSVLSRLLERAKAKDWTVDRVAIVGGFGQFPFVQQTILKRLGIGDQDVRFDATIMNSDVRAYAVAYGSALIAKGLSSRWNITLTLSAFSPTERRKVYWPKHFSP